MNFLIVTLILMWEKFLGQCEKLLPMKEDLIQEVQLSGDASQFYFDCFQNVTYNCYGKTLPLKKVLPIDFLRIFLRYKTITSQTVSSEAHVKNFYIS